MNSFLAEGGDNFTAFKSGTDRIDAGSDLAALEDYLARHAGELRYHSVGRIARLPE